MIREEYNFYDIDEYLYDHNDLLIVGKQGAEERSTFLFNCWTDKRKKVLLLERLVDDTVFYEYYTEGIIVESETINLSNGIPRLLRHLNINQKAILVDLSSLDHVLIMFLTKVLISQVIPKTLFAAYIRPKKYRHQSGNVGFSLCDQISGVKSVPGFIRRESNVQTLCTFIGFEGLRLKSVLESVHNVERFVPVVAFPSGAPQWYNVTMWNSMDILQSEVPDYAICKCFSESIFEAVNLLRSYIKLDEKVVLAPLGTRPHSMACAIYACEHPNARIIYDYVIEREHRAEGIDHIIVYHLSSFLNT